MKQMQEWSPACGAACAEELLYCTHNAETRFGLPAVSKGKEKGCEKVE